MKIGSLCTGYGGLDHGVQAVYGGNTVWVSDIDKGARKILAHRYPDVPNLGDFTITDWTTVEPVDVLTAGYPCQPFSHAGQRKGTTDDRHIWPHVRQAIRCLRPRLTLLENVAGHRSLGFDRVLGDLAEDRMHVRWTSLRAADIGAPHGRERLFIAVTYPDGGFNLPSLARADQRAVPDRNGRSAPSSLLPSPRTSDSNGAGVHGDGGLDLRTAVTLLPIPAVNDMGAGKTVEAWDAWTERMKAAHGNGNGHGASLAIEAQRLLPTPTSADSEASGSAGYNGNQFCTLTDATVRRPTSWGDYGPAIARWEHTIGRPAPAPTQTSSKGTQHLAPAFVEWMMGLPAGHVTDVPELTRNEQLKALGNGVVPQQAAAAIHMMAQQ